MEKEHGMTGRHPDSPKDWECYRGCTSYGELIRRAGDMVFYELYRRMSDGKENLISEFLELFVGMPYDYKAFRGVTAYIARKAAKVGLCYVVSPVIEFSMDVHTVTVKNFEMALIRAKEVEDTGCATIERHSRAEKMLSWEETEKDGRPPVTPRAKTYDAHTAEAEYLLGVLWNGLHNTDGMDAKAADRVAEIAHEEDRVQPTTTPKNDPLTLEELRKMDGEPVWIDDWYEDFHGWELSETASDYFDGESRTVEAYGTRWVAYRRKPEEEK